ncbi:MAG: UDP-N-acetylmuramoyl-L-alanyl-D-glutamate--2,6-diaminopimelate ligase [Candidatus Pacebacteria bacterium]|nr:UDP-N-acetylmuramoyl-L-alanyl-D-glutamate--2,6-diaminopimelate ligase [Candidatus Paceibacterota bacterium]
MEEDNVFLKEILKKILPKTFVNFYHFFLTFFGALIFNFPSKNLKVVGVTGTNGKSTTVEFITRILEEAGFKIASISSIRFKIGKEKTHNFLKMTMPEGFLIQKFLKKAERKRCNWVVLEVTSEGIKQFRHKFIDFDIAVFTNLRPEHIEAHGSFEKYREAKGKLFEALSKSKKYKKDKKVKKISVINIDDENASFYLKFWADEKWGYRIEGEQLNSKEIATLYDKILEARDCRIEKEGVSFKVKDKEFNLKLKGKFNIYNALAAICVALSQGIDLEVIKSALEKVGGVVGRLEEVISYPFKVIVDYAHTPDALEEVYKTLIQDLSKENKLICVFGACGGGRDKWKRPKFGEIADKYCRKIILTNEDPYDEDPEQILRDIEKGIQGKEKVVKIIDRRKAIKKALEIAQSGDTVIITGKGCEPWMCVKGGKKIPWDDRKIVKEEFEKLNKE